MSHRSERFTPEGHVDDVGCWCGPEVDPVAGLMHVLEADGSPEVELPVEPALAALAWHDVTCPEGPDCRDRSLHAASDPIANTGTLDRFLTQLGALG